MLNLVWCLTFLYIISYSWATPEKRYAAECILPAEVGPCRALKKLYYYNAVIETCQRFGWGGCKGNANQFIRKEECEERCANATGIDGKKLVCELKKDVGNVDCLQDKDTLPVRRFYFNDFTHDCLPMQYKGCGGNQNNFPSVGQCLDACFLSAGTSADEP